MRGLTLLSIPQRFMPLILLAGDLLVLLIFTYIGQRTHNLIDPRHPILGLLLTTGEFALPWAVVGWVLGAFPGDDSLTIRPLLARSLNAWLVAAPLGLLLRAYILGRAVIPTSFFSVTLGLGGAFILGWRLAFTLIWKTTLSQK